MPDFISPIQLNFKKSTAQSGQPPQPIHLFSSYVFDKNILTPSSAFRFTAEGVDKATRMAIRSGDSCYLTAQTPKGDVVQLGCGIIDETDVHVVANSLEYVLSGRDFLGQLVDNSSVDSQNQIINLKNCSIATIVQTMIKNTRLPQTFIMSQVPNTALLFQTNAGETKLSSIQRYLDMLNCLIWSNSQGQVVIGKPNFTQNSQGSLYLSYTNPKGNNVLEARVKRNLNQAVRQCVTQLTSLKQLNAGEYTLINSDPDMRALSSGLVGRSLYRSFQYGQGVDSANQITAVGNQSAQPRSIGNEYTAREIARENMKLIDVDIAVEGHFNANGIPYDYDQVYSVFIEDEDVAEDMYVYAVSYELTLTHGLMTKLKLCKLWSICAYADQLKRVAQ